MQWCVRACSYPCGLQPDIAIDTAVQWLVLIKARVSECCDKLKKSSPAQLTALLEKAADLVKHHEHPDRCACVVGCAAARMTCCVLLSQRADYADVHSAHHCGRQV
jgi:hypothetical protein